MFASLPEQDLALIAGRAGDVVLGEGDWLIQEGEVAAFFVLIEGRLAVTKSVGGRAVQINSYAPGDCFGELPLMLGSAAVAGLRALGPCRVARLEDRDFRELILQHPELNRGVIRMMAERVGHLQEVATEAPVSVVTIVGDRLDLACHGLRDFLARNRVAYTWQQPTEQMPRSAGGDTALPVVVLADGTRLVDPSLPSVASAVGLHVTPRHGEYDVVIVGAGPAGLAAAVYGASEGLSTLLVERMATGGQAGTSSRIENYLGFPAGLSGDELGGRARQQAERFGAEITVACPARELLVGDRHTLVLDDGACVLARAVVLALGVEWRRLSIPGAERYEGRGVYYGAARTDALSTRGRSIHLIGGGNSAGQAAMHFSSYAERVTLLLRGPKLEAGMSEYLIRQLASKTNISVALDTDAVAFEGEDVLEALMLRDRVKGATSRTSTDGVFVFIGATAKTEWLPDRLQRDRVGQLCTGREVDPELWPLERDPLLLETSVPGVFAAGDVRSGSIKRVASSVGEGSMSIAFVHQHLATSG